MSVRVLVWLTMFITTAVFGEQGTTQNRERPARGSTTVTAPVFVNANGQPIGVQVKIRANAYIEIWWRSPYGGVPIELLRGSDTDPPQQWRPAPAYSLYFATADCSGQAYLGGGNGTVPPISEMVLIRRTPTTYWLYEREQSYSMAPLPVVFVNGQATVSRISQGTGACESYVASAATLFHPVAPIADVSADMAAPFTIQ